jgi:arabinosaccharide transport system substrate-binding protein
MELKNNEALDEKRKVVNLNFWTFKKDHITFMKNSVDTWNRSEKGNSIIFDSSLFPYDELHEKLYTSLKSGVNLPDITDIEISKFMYYFKDGIYFESLNEILKPEYENFIKSRIDNYTVDGDCYGIDYYTGSTFMFYNKELMERAKVNPDDIKTWNDYIIAGKKVFYTTKRPMTTISVTDYLSFYPILKQQGEDLLNEAGLINLTNEKSINTLQFVHNMIYKDNIAIPAPGGNHYSIEYFEFMDKGGAASVMMPSYYMNIMEENMESLKGKFIIKPLPRWDENSKKSAGIGGIATSVLKNSKEKDTAVEFLNYAKVSKEGCMRIWEQLEYEPIRWDVLEELEENNLSDYFENDIIENFESVKYDIDSVENIIGYDNAIKILEDDVLKNVLYKDNINIESSLKKAEEKFKSIK